MKKYIAIFDNMHFYVSYSLGMFKISELKIFNSVLAQKSNSIFTDQTVMIIIITIINSNTNSNIIFLNANYPSNTSVDL